MSTIIISAIAVVAVCALAITGAILKKYKKFELIEKINSYQGIALKIFQKVEAIIPNDYGSADDAPVWQKAANKLDVFLREFERFYKQTEGGNLTDEMKNELRNWVQHWAEVQKAKSKNPTTDDKNPV